jgi:hypothetical protein
MRTLTRIFPERRVIGVQAREILLAAAASIASRSRCLRADLSESGQARLQQARAVVARRLLAAQLEMRKAAKFSIALIVSGAPAAGRSET